MTRALRTLAGVALMAATALAAVVSGGAAAWAAQPTTWNFTQADIPPAQPLGNYGRGVLVAVVDTWIDFSQPEFSGRVVDEANCTSGTCVDRQYAPDECVHGTHVAGTIASDQYGVAPEADILAVQVLTGPPGSANDPNATCSGSSDAVAAGIDFAVAKGARVINLSLADEVPGLFQSSAITAAVDNAASHDVLVVFAAGNDDLPLTDDYGSNALIVAATGPSGQLASYSNFNSPATGDVDVAAPGGDTGSAASCSTSDCILSTFPHDQLGLLEGTSMAAPHVSGLAALLFSQDPSRSAANVIATIEHTARPLAGAGAGLIDAKAALDVEAASHPPQAGPAPSSPSTAPAASGTAAAAPTAPPSAASGPSSGALPLPSSSPAARTPLAATVAAGTSSPASAPHLAEATPTPTTVAERPASSRPGSTHAVAAGHPGAAKSTPGWADRHAGWLIGASVLLVVDLLSLAWTREARRLFGSP